MVGKVASKEGMQNHSITFSLSRPRREAPCPIPTRLQRLQERKSSPTAAEEALEVHKAGHEAVGSVTPRVTPNRGKKEL